MSVQNGERLVTKQDLADFYNDIRPYMGGLVTSKAGFTPIGTIISVMGTTAPVNYLACDGTVYNIADYTELANYFNEQFGSKNFFGGNGTTTFAVPDLRGEFLRGTGTNSHTGNGDGASVGVHQDATQIPNMNKNIGTDGGLCISKNSKDTTNADTIEGGIGWQYLAKGTREHETSTSQKDYFTARPTNTSVLYCIATKNFYIDPTLDYSTEEKIVGTWIDGKPLYQKVIYQTNANNFTPNVDIDMGLVSDDLEYGHFVLVETNAGGLNPGWNYGGGTYRSIINIFVRQANKHLIVQFARADISEFTAVLQYTKTTD